MTIIISLFFLSNFFTFDPISVKLFLLGLLVGVLQIVVGIPSFILTIYAFLVHSEILGVIPRIISYIMGSIIFTPVVLIFTYLLYSNLKREKGDSPLTNLKQTKLRIVTFAIAGYLLAIMMIILFVYAAASFNKLQKQQQFYNRSYELSPTPGFKYPVNIPKPTSMTAKCIKSSKEDICEGYKLLIPGFSNLCYITIKECLEAENNITPSSSPSPSLYKKPAIHPTIQPVVPGV